MIIPKEEFREALRLLGYELVEYKDIKVINNLSNIVISTTLDISESFDLLGNYIGSNIYRDELGIYYIYIGRYSSISDAAKLISIIEADPIDRIRALNYFSKIVGIGTLVYRYTEQVKHQLYDVYLKRIETLSRSATEKLKEFAYWYYDSEAQEFVYKDKIRVYKAKYKGHLFVFKKPLCTVSKLSFNLSGDIHATGRHPNINRSGICFGDLALKSSDLVFMAKNLPKTLEIANLDSCFSNKFNARLQNRLLDILDGKQDDELLKKAKIMEGGIIYA